MLNISKTLFRLNRFNNLLFGLLSPYSQQLKFKKVRIHSLELLASNPPQEFLKQIQLQKQKVFHVVTNSIIQTVDQNQQLLQIIKSQPNYKFVSNFQSSLAEAECIVDEKSPQKKCKSNQRSIQLIVGDYSQQFFKLIDISKVLTLQQLCSIFPQKIPLSYRSRETLQKKQFLQKRLNKNKQHKLNLDQQPSFSKIFFCSNKIKMWDQAIQVILDCQPSPIVIPYHRSKNTETFYKLSKNDFISGLKTCYELIHKGQPPRQIKQFKAVDHIKYILSNLSNDIIDRNAKIQIDADACRSEKDQQSFTKENCRQIYREMCQYQIKII